MRLVALVGLISSLSCAPVSAQLAIAPTQTAIEPEPGLNLRYPAALNKEDATHVSAFEHAVFALHPEADPNHTGADPCAPLVMALGSGLDQPAQILQKGKAPIFPAKGTLTLSEIKRSCLDKDALDDTTLAGLVGQVEKLDGMRTLTHTTNGFVQGTTVWWATSAGFLKDAKGHRSASAGTIILGSVGAVVHGHVLLWSITANDPQLFNRLVNLSVCFDAPECREGYSQLVQIQLATPKLTETASR